MEFLVQNKVSMGFQMTSEVWKDSLLMDKASMVGLIIVPVLKGFLQAVMGSLESQLVVLEFGEFPKLNEVFSVNPIVVVVLWVYRGPVVELLDEAPLVVGFRIK